MDDLVQGVTREDVISAYRLILGRDPESESIVRQQMDRHKSLRGLHKAFLGSREFRIQIPNVAPGELYPGYTKEDLKIFERFPVAERSSKEGYITDFLGTITRASFVKRTLPLGGSVLGYPIPCDFHAEVIEWLGLLKSAVSARDCYRVLELGAGWGPWLSAGYAAARRCGIPEFRLVAVEADAGHASFIAQHLNDNGISDQYYEIIQAAIGTTGGMLKWPVVEDLSTHYGLRPSEREESLYNGQKFNKYIDVQVVAVNDVLFKEPAWDLVHIDIQGHEVEVCQSALSELTARVRWLVIGTHSRKIDGDLMEMFWKAGWKLEHEKPSRFTFKVGCPNFLKA